MSEVGAAIFDDGRTIQSDIRLVGDLVRGQWRIFLFSVLAVVAIVISALAFLPPQFDAQAVLLVQHRPESLADEKVQSTPPELVRSQLDIIQSRPVLEAVVRRLSLASDPEFSSRKQQSRTGREREAASVATAAQRIGDRLSVENDGRSSVIRLKFRARDPNRAALIANAIVDEYIRLERVQKVQSAQSVMRSLSTKVSELRQRSRDTELAAEDFRRDSNLVVLTDGVDAARTDGGFTSASREAVEAARQKAEFDAQAAQADAKLAVQRRQILDGQGGNTSEVTNSPLIARLREQEAELSRSEAGLLARYKPDHPLVAPVHAQVVALRGTIEAETARVHDVVRSQSEVARQSERLLAGVVSNLNQKVNGQISATIWLRQLQGEARVQRALYEEFAAKAGRAAAQIDLQLPDVLIISPATPPIAAASPRKPLLLAAALVIGVFGGCCCGLVFALARRRLLGASEAARITGLQVVWSSDQLGSHSGLPSRLSDAECTSLERMTARALAEAKGHKPVLICLVSPDEHGSRSFGANWACELSAADAAVLFVSDGGLVSLDSRSGPPPEVKIKSASALSKAILRDPSFGAFRQEAEPDFGSADFVIVETAADGVLFPVLGAIYQVHLCILLVNDRLTTKADARDASRRLREISFEPNGLALI